MSVVTQYAPISKAKHRRCVSERVARVSVRPRNTSRPPLADRLRFGWTDFLSRIPWDVFATLTYRPPLSCADREDRSRFKVWNGPSAEVLVRNVKRWLWLWQLRIAIERGQAWLADDGGHDPFSVISRDRVTVPRRARGPWANAYRSGRCYAQWIIGIEPHKSGILHAHVMIHWSDRLKNLRHRDGWELWFQQYGRADIDEPRSGHDVARYLSKAYTVKGGDLYLSPSFNAIKPLKREPFVAADLVQRLLREDSTPSPRVGPADAYAVPRVSQAHCGATSSK